MTDTERDQKNTSKCRALAASLKEMIGEFGLKRAMTFPVLALFFIVIIIIYHLFLMNYAKQGILNRSQSDAGRSSNEIERYLSSGTDTLEMAAYSLDRMISSGEKHEEVLDYLKEETDVIMNSILPETTGLYACIHGEYHDGAGWNPGRDYVPEERPWYRAAVAGDGRIVLVNPYLDLYTGNVMMTLAKCLSDKESVIALDIDLSGIQKIIEGRTGPQANTDIMVIGNDGIVVAHSDRNEVGKNYCEMPDTLGNAIIKSIPSATGVNYDVRFDGRTYSACAIPMSNGWYCISFSDSGQIYRPIRLMMVLSVLAVIVTLLIFTFITVNAGQKELARRRLQSLLNSSADIYMSLCDLDVIDNSVTEIKNVNPAIAEAVKTVDHNMKEVFLGIMKRLPDNPTKAAAVEFTDLSTIDERMKYSSNATLEYLSFGNIWVRARLIVSERTKDGRVSHVLWMLENITEEKRERDKLINMSEKALAASEAKSAFLSTMSHEIRTPINAVLGMNEMILRECDDPDIISYSQNIKSAGNSLLVLINDILDFSKIESGRMEIVPTEYDFASLLNDLVNMIKVRMDAKGLELILDIDPEIPVSLFGDEVRIKQILTNILTNAAKYTEKGSVTLKITIDPAVRATNCVILNFSVKDTGIGIKKEDISKLFTAFERIDEKKNRHIEGTGLGMSISNNLLLMMGSSMNVKSEYGKGSEFSFGLMQTVREWKPIGDYRALFTASVARQNKYVPKFTAKNAKILVVDDTHVNLMVFKGLLKKTGINIDTADSGRRCIELASENKYDIIFLDHMMPDMDGIETLHEMNSRAENINTDTPVICLTANAISGAKEKYIDEGFDDYLSKPINAEHLENMIIRYLPEELIDKPASDEPDATN
ncbi:MAG: response regulator [Lachnospiraceae bacterium]|nr:response regulator [Lachnospiraceae bacterium]